MKKFLHHPTQFCTRIVESAKFAFHDFHDGDDKALRATVSIILNLTLEGTHFYFSATYWFSLLIPLEKNADIIVQQGAIPFLAQLIRLERCDVKAIRALYNLSVLNRSPSTL